MSLRNILNTLTSEIERINGAGKLNTRNSLVDSGWQKDFPHNWGRIGKVTDKYRADRK
jgi:hypothetical protein